MSFVRSGCLLGCFSIAFWILVEPFWEPWGNLSEALKVFMFQKDLKKIRVPISGFGLRRVLGVLSGVFFSRFCGLFLNPFETSGALLGDFW